MNINNVNLYVYFGAIVVESEITSFMRQIGKKDHMYGFIMGNNLQYKYIGDVKTSKEIVIGQEIFLNSQDCLIKLQDVLTKNTKILPRLGSDYKTFNIDETTIREKLHKTGVFTEPQYYIIVNYMV